MLHPHREGIEEDSSEEKDEEKNDKGEDDPLEAPPQDVPHGLVGRREPQEGGIGAPGKQRIQFRDYFYSLEQENTGCD